MNNQFKKVDIDALEKYAGGYQADHTGGGGSSSGGDALLCVGSVWGMVGQVGTSSWGNWGCGSATHYTEYMNEYCRK
ncbi:hypothetical protein JOC78_003413 [Bacillus ectoiniformans]|uniref:hypothetical protein n=1 Tax=Bacillus ectoiniformans TaxID=1494429 RepID=UPI00195AAA71|nr:hypothetical protein [Bacillus ectoiniformans]MBM7650423.1 hypothetical protein [Bacillus ectoiniformans]